MSDAIAIIAAGAMGSAVAACLTAEGRTVRTCLAGRSDASRARAAKAGMVDADLATIAQSRVILSILPPGEALGLARSLAPFLAGAPAAARAVFADCNAIAPASMHAVAAALAPSGCAVVDGAIIGPPPHPGGAGTKLYLAGEAAPRLADLAVPGLVVRVMDAPLGAASALKMSYAGITKGFTALGAAMMLAAEAAGAAPALHAELSESQLPLLSWLSGQMPKMPDKAYRWVAEMEEIAAFIPPAAEAAPIYRAIAAFYAAIAADHRDGGAAVAALMQFCSQEKGR
ncbi:MAG: DUF1932 domain-containing protein [Rhodospirillales bacterium]|nr:DUF1932 domain-containing protein [Rhodospirillales bacterium]